MELTFLGTGAGLPSHERNVTAIVLNLLTESNQCWLFDCGEGTQHQFLKTTLKPRKITKIFITHLHGDHLFGLPGLLSSRSFQGGEDGIIIYGPEGIRNFVETSLQISQSRLAYPISFVELTEAGPVFEDEQFIVDCVLLDHGVTSFGYRVKEKERLGSLQTDKLRKMGIFPGPIYQQIKESPVTTLEDGTVIHRADVLGAPKPGKTVIIFGDTRYVAHHREFIKEADALVHEATFDKTKTELATNYYHSTATQAAQFANDSNIGSLYLTHISARYQANRAQQLQDEARDIFPNTYVVSDLETYSITS